MKTRMLRCLSMAFMLVAFCMGAQAQGFLKKIGKAVEKSVEVVSESAEAVDSVSTVSSAQDSLAMALLEDPQFTVVPTYQLDEKGDTVRNEDGTAQLRYIVYDGNGKACDPNFVKEKISLRTKQYGIILKKVGAGALAGGVAAWTKGGKKDAVKGALAGGALGILGSTSNIAQIKKINNNLKEYKKVIEAYQKTFTEEGLPIDATADLSNVDGIDFTKNEAITKSSAEIAQELAASKESIGSLDDIDLSSLG